MKLAGAVLILALAAVAITIGRSMIHRRRCAVCRYVDQLKRRS